jgi:hypothetical protein
VQYSTWNDQRFLYICSDSLNFSSSDLISFNICQNSSFVQLNDARDTNDINEINETKNAHDVSGMSNRRLINDDIFKVQIITSIIIVIAQISSSASTFDEQRWSIEMPSRF